MHTDPGNRDTDTNTDKHQTGTQPHLPREKVFGSNFSIFFKLMVTFIYFRYFVIFSTSHDILLIYI